MIKKLLSLAGFAFFAGNISGQSFSLYYPFSSVTGTAALITTDPTPAPTATGVTSGSFTAVGTGTGSTASGVFSFVGWGAGATNSNNVTFTGAIDLGKYYEIVLSPQPNYVITLNSMSFGATRSGTGARHWAIRTNKDGYTANAAATYTPFSSAASNSPVPISVQGGNTFFWNDDAVANPAAFATYNICEVKFSGPNYTSQFTPFNIRMYAWDAEGTGGTFRIDTVLIKGSATFSAGVGLPTITHDLNAGFKLYPNPTSDGFVNLEALKNNFSKIEVVNTLGSVVASQNEILADRIKLNLTALPEGTYFVRITSGNKISTEKLIISK